MDEKRRYSTGEFARKANVSIRTIHYYHDKKLIKPSFISETGYRYYSDEDFAKLQKILILKHLGFSLEEIREISLNEEDSDFLKDSFSLQLELVRKRIARLQFVERSIQRMAERFDAEGTVDWDAMTQLIHIVDMEKDLVEQYKNGKNIKSRIYLHERYAVNPQGWFPWLFSQLPDLQTAQVLEVGCGDGAFWKQSKPVPADWEITLTDISRGMLEDARENLSDVPIREYLVADCQKLPYEGDRFDLVIANHVLFYARNIGDALEELRRVLKPGGWLLCATYGKKHMCEVEELVKEYNPSIRLSRIRLFECFGLENGAQWLEKYFRDLEVREYPDELKVTEVEPLIDYILSCHGNQRDYLMPDFQRFRQFLTEKLKIHGSIHISKQAGVFIARKEER